MKKQIFILSVILIFVLSVGAQANRRNRNAKNAPEINYAAEMKQYGSEELRKIALESRQNGDNRRLAAALSALVSLEPSRFDLRIQLGDVLFTDEKYDEAIRVLNEAAAIIPSDAAPHKLLAQIYNKMGDDSKRYFHLNNAATFGVNSWENQFMLALYYTEKGIYERAELFFTKAIELNSEAAAAKFEYGKMFLKKGDSESAFQEFGHALLLESDNPYFLAYRAYTAALTGREGMVSEPIETALSRLPRDSQVLYLRAMIHNVYGETAEAKKILNDALRHSPNDFQLMEALADLLVTEMRFKEACRYYLLIIEKDGSTRERAFKLGKALALDMKYKEALAFFEAAAKADNNDEVLYWLADVYCELGDINQAQTVLERFGGKRSVEWYQATAGRVYEARSESYLAWIAFSTSSKFNGDNPHVNAGFGRLLVERSEYDSAITFFNLAAQKNPLDMRILLNIAKMYEKMGEDEKALQFYEDVLAKYPEHPNVYITVASKRALKEDYKGAVKCLTDALALRPKDPKINFMLGQMLRADGSFEAAIKAYQAVVKERNNRNIEAFRMIGLIYYSDLANEKKAREFFRRYIKEGGKNSEVDGILEKLNTKNKS